MNEKQYNILIELGFTIHDNGKGGHCFIVDENSFNHVFDFSASSLQGIPKIIFDGGFKKGYEKCQSEIKKALGL